MREEGWLETRNDDDDDDDGSIRRLLFRLSRAASLRRSSRMTISRSNDSGNEAGGFGVSATIEDIYSLVDVPRPMNNASTSSESVIS